MIEFLFTNPIALLFAVTIVMVVAMFIVIRPDKKKKGKSSNNKASSAEKKEEKKEDKPSDGENKTEQSKSESDEVKTESDSTEKTKKKVKKSREKPTIEPVFKKKVQEKVEESKKEEIQDDDLERRAQFVKTSGKISKFIGITDVNERDQVLNQIADGNIEEIELHDDCEVCDAVVSHFDHSRRLSKIIKDDLFDQMFAEHLSSKYLNIDENRHLKDVDKFTEALYERAMKTLSNSEVKLMVEGDEKEGKPVETMKNDKAYMKEWLENQKKEQWAKIMAQDGGNTELDDETMEIVGEQVDLSAKNIVVVDSILNRKGKRTTKK